MLRAGRWLRATYGPFIRLSAVSALYLVASGLAAELAYRTSHAALICVAGGILVAAYPFTRRDQLRAAWRREYQIARSHGNDHRRAQESV